MTHFSHETQNSRLNQIIITVFSAAVIVLTAALSLAQFAVA
ncbi:MAG TPA: hypothetical protein VLW75_09265 [Rhizomicrobium sp.]|nr:hypothetical protein [Rhizomicrobium sp.]